MPQKETHDDTIDDVIGKTAIVISRVGSALYGTVMIPIRGGSEEFSALPATDVILERGTAVTITSYFPPRTVFVAAIPKEDK